MRGPQPSPKFTSYFLFFHLDVYRVLVDFFDRFPVGLVRIAAHLPDEIFDSFPADRSEVRFASQLRLLVGYFVLSAKCSESATVVL